MKIGNTILPDSCPTNCAFKEQPLYQGCACTRCPIFNCVGKDRLLEPDCYREDWAKEWEKFFETGEFPILKLECKG